MEFSRAKNRKILQAGSRGVDAPVMAVSQTSIWVVLKAFLHPWLTLARIFLNIVAHHDHVVTNWISQSWRNLIVSFWMRQTGSLSSCLQMFYTLLSVGSFQDGRRNICHGYVSYYFWPARYIWTHVFKGPVLCAFSDHYFCSLTPVEHNSMFCPLCSTSISAPCGRSQSSRSC